MKDSLRVMMLGLRGFPGVQGGIEKHVEQLVPRLVALGCAVTVVTRSPYVKPITAFQGEGVRFLRVWAPRHRGLEAIVHTGLGVLVAGWTRPDVLHIHAIGPALWTPMARLLGLRVVVTHHGPDYDREKWGGLARAVLRLGEWCGMRFASERIVISRVIEALVVQRHGRASNVIPNGVVPCDHAATTRSNVLDTFDLQANRYVLLVSRLVPEKRHRDLIEAFKRAALGGWKLVLVGDADHPDDYVRNLCRLAVATSGVVMTGVQSGDELAALYAQAGVFVLPSSHEGLPIVLLEALATGQPVLASAIPANLEVGLPADCYFPVGDIDALQQRLVHIAGAEGSPSNRVDRLLIASRYNWGEVARQVAAVYCRAARRDDITDPILERRGSLGP